MIKLSNLYPGPAYFVQLLHLIQILDLLLFKLALFFSYVWRLFIKRPRVWPLFIFQYYYKTRKLRTIRKEKQRLN